MSYQYQNSPIMARKQSTHSPQKLAYSINLSQRSKSKGRSELSPRKTQPLYTVHHEDKLKVFVKFKPPSSCSNNKFINVTYINQKQVEIERQSTSNKIYSYDHVFHQKVSSQQVFSSACLDVINQVVHESKNGLIFVYGHTGTGKTFTMGLLDSVDDKSKGIVPESLRYIFKMKDRMGQKFGKNGEMKISISFNEIYMDEVYDMLDFEGQKKLQIRENQTTKQPYIQNNISITTNSIAEAYQLINIGLEKRTVAQQKINKRSSRGHGLITINVTMNNGKLSKLCFVDLAGSERIKESESTGKTLSQAVHINSSLSALEALLMSIGEQSIRMYRGNKLTRLLQPFMQSGKIRLFVTSNYENIQPLEFGKRCKGIKFMQRDVESGRILSSGVAQGGHLKELEKYKKQVEKLENENKILMQVYSSTVIMLNKISKAVILMLEEQNIHSNFVLTNDINIPINKDIEQRINKKIATFEQNQHTIIESCLQNIEKLNGNDGKDDSFNTSSSMNVGMNKSGVQMAENQNWIHMLQDPKRLNKRIHDLGFGVLQSFKELSGLCQYKNVYKREIFTECIKAELLLNKNKQLENATNYLLKNCGDSTGGVPKKIIKQLQQFGVDVNNTNKSPFKSKSIKNSAKTSIPCLNSNLQMSSKNTLTPTIQKTKLTNNNDNQFFNIDSNYKVGGFQQCNNDDEQLFKEHENNSINCNRFLDQRGMQKKGHHRVNTNPVKKQNERGSKRDGLILIQDL